MEKSLPRYIAYPFLITFSVVIWMFLFALTGKAYAHGGGLDEAGGHTRSASGLYHSHLSNFDWANAKELSRTETLIRVEVKNFKRMCVMLFRETDDSIAPMLMGTEGCREMTTSEFAKQSVARKQFDALVQQSNPKKPAAIDGEERFAKAMNFEAER